MAEEHRRVVATTEAHARALAENLVNNGFVVTEATSVTWVVRKRRRRGDIVTTIVIQQPVASSAPTAPPTVSPWGPPRRPVR